MRKMYLGKSIDMERVEKVWTCKGALQGEEHFYSLLPKSKHIALAKWEKFHERCKSINFQNTLTLP